MNKRQYAWYVLGWVLAKIGYRFEAMSRGCDRRTGMSEFDIMIAESLER